MHTMVYLFLFCLLFYSTSIINASVLILTHVFNKPEYIWWQNATLKKFIKDDYKFVVFNDAPNSEISSKVSKICEELNITYINVPQVIHDSKNPYLPQQQPANRSGSVECAETIQYMLDTVGFAHSGITVLLDADMFPIRDINIEETMQGYEIAANPQYRQGTNEKIKYFLPNLIFFNIPSLQDKREINFNLGIIDNVRVDTGGFTYFYIKSHPLLKWLKTNCLYSLNENATPELLRHFQSFPKMNKLMTERKYDVEFYANYSFLHFRGYGIGRPADKMKSCFEALDDVLGSSTI